MTAHQESFEERQTDRMLREADRVLDERLDRALNAAPALTLPADFAARMAALLPAAAPAPTHYGRTALLLCGLLLAAALLFLVTRGPGHAMPWLATLFSMELAVLAVGAGSWRQVLRLSE